MNATRNLFGLMATPAPADIAAAHTEALDTLDFDKVIAALPDAVDTAMRNALPGRYTPELAAQFAQAMAAELRNPTGCPVYPGLCTETEPGHHDHSNHENTVTNKSGDHLLDVGFVQLSDGGPAIVYIGGMSSEDYLPEEVRPATARLRQLLDEADAIADRLMAQQARA
jgi:hypothetical protein